MKLYLDVCCLNRPFDDQTQDRIHLEAESILLILKYIRSKKWEWFNSEVVEYEVRQTSDAERRRRLEMLLSHADHKIIIEEAVISRAATLEKIGFDPYDALHLACAEYSGVDVFLTTDDKLLRLANRVGSQLVTPVKNPLTWLMEVRSYGN